MPDMQELISRGRFILGGSPKRLEVFRLIDGKRTAKEIAIKTARNHSAVLNDIKKMADLELIREVANGKVRAAPVKSRNLIYEKNPILKHIQTTYFKPVADTTKLAKKTKLKKVRTPKHAVKISIPAEKAILDICRNGEDQLYEFKSPGTDPNKISREVAAFLHTKNGGIVFYGIDDQGTIVGSDRKRQDFDQSMQNSVRSCISPAPTIRIVQKTVFNAAIILVLVDPWDGKTFYQFQNTAYLIRKGTNVFHLKPDEIAKLSRGEYVI